MTDLFEEVEEQLRSDRYQQFARKALPWLLGLAAVALVITLGYWGWQTYNRSQISKASETYAAGVDAIANGDNAKARALLTEVSTSSAAAYKSLALMHLAALAQRDNNVAEAVRLLDAAAKAAPDPVIGDAARLKSAFALLDTAPLTEVEGRLKPLMDEGRPYRIQAREALAYAKLNAGDLKGARGDFQLIAQSIDASQAAQARAQAAVALIDAGSAKAIPSIVKAAAALPPTPPGPATPQPQANAPQ